MRFYTQQHPYYCGIDLHTRLMYVCIIDSSGTVLVHRNIRARPEPFLELIGPYEKDLVVAVECIFTWYWLADLCAQRGIPFVLGHAFYMKAIHGVKTKNDKIDSQKIASLLRSGMFPLAYSYPHSMRSTRDLLRRRMHLMHRRAELLAHIQNTASQYNLDPPGKKIAYKVNRVGLAEQFPDPWVRQSIECDVRLIEAHETLIREVELKLRHSAQAHDPGSYELLRTVPGIGVVLALLILYEVCDITRFPTVGQFLSYCRLVKCAQESAGKKTGSKRNKIGNPYLKWAFSEAACLALRANEPAQKAHEKLVSRYGKAKALYLLAQKLGRAVYSILKRKEPFDSSRFFDSL